MVSSLQYLLYSFLGSVCNSQLSVVLRAEGFALQLRQAVHYRLLKINLLNCRNFLVCDLLFGLHYGNFYFLFFCSLRNILVQMYVKSYSCLSPSILVQGGWITVFGCFCQIVFLFSLFYQKRKQVTTYVPVFQSNRLSD